MAEICGWDAAPCECSALNNIVDVETADQIRRMAVERLWRWTNRRFGLCPVEVRPCADDCYPGGRWPVHPIGSGGTFINVGCGECQNHCGCKRLEQVLLPGPVRSIEQILLNGAELDLSGVRVDDYSLLVRQDGGRWPRCQNLELPPTEDGTWLIRYTKGEPVPAGGEILAGMLACEYAKSLCGEGDCRLPRRVQTITRQGVTVGFVDNFDGIESGRSGIWEIDDWVLSNTKPARAATIRSPDVRRQRVTTWTAPVLTP